MHHQCQDEDSLCHISVMFAGEIRYTIQNSKLIVLKKTGNFEQPGHLNSFYRMVTPLDNWLQENRLKVHPIAENGTCSASVA